MEELSKPSGGIDRRWLVIGCGNIVRGDDGLGNYLACEIEQRVHERVEVRSVQQLTWELADDFHEFDAVLVLDAAETGPDWEIRFLDPEEEPVSSSHHVNAAALVRLANSLGQDRTPLFVCAVRGDQFGFSATLSDAARRRADEALPAIEQLLRTGKTRQLYA